MTNDLELLQAVTPLDLQADGSVFVEGKLYRYHIAPGRTTYVYDRKTGANVGSLCIQFYELCPEYDRVIAEYILIKNDEFGYLRTANLSGSLQVYLGLPLWTRLTVAGVVTTLVGIASFLLFR